MDEESQLLLDGGVGASYHDYGVSDDLTPTPRASRFDASSQLGKEDEEGKGKMKG